MSDEPVLLMAPAKVLNRLGRTRLSSVLPAGSVLFTSDEIHVDRSRLADIRTFADYTHDDELPLLASAAIECHGLERVLVLAEADILRAAELRERHGLPGQLPDEAILYRDKPAMKAQVAAAGVAVAPHRVVTSGLELSDAVAELGFPCVVKPPHGRGSSGVEILTNSQDLTDLLRRGPFSDRGHIMALLVESFQFGEQYRVDGVYQNGVLRLISVALYAGSHLDYLSGGYLGSLIMPEESPEAREILDLAQLVMEKALPRFDGGFHLEAFLSPNGPVFSEVGARLGGGSIPEEIELAYGVNITEEAILAQRGAPILGRRPRQQSLAGQLHVSPQPGLLVQAPERLTHPAVVLSEIALPNRHYTSMSHTNAEYARAVFTAESPSDGLVTIGALVRELETSTRWVNEPEGIVE